MRLWTMVSIFASSTVLSIGALQAQVTDEARFVAQAREQFVGQWFMDVEDTAVWDGTRFGNKTGRELACEKCCRQNYKQNARIDVKQDSGLNGVFASGNYITIRKNTSGTIIDPDWKAHWEKLNWSVICAPSEAQNGAERAHATFSQSNGSIYLNISYEDGRSYDYKVRPISRQIFERIHPDANRLFRRG